MSDNVSKHSNTTNSKVRYYDTILQKLNDENSEKKDKCIHLNSFPNWLNEEPCNVGNLFIASILALYIFWMLAYVCEEYLIPAMEKFCKVTHIPHDIAGATLMAATTSSPEIFISLIGTFVTESDIGISTIVGSSVFNCMAICGLCGFTVTEPVKLEWWSLVREIFWFLISVVTMTIIMFDATINLYEAIGLIVVYILMIIFLACDKQLRKCILPKPHPQIDSNVPKKQNLAEKPKVVADEDEKPLPTCRESFCSYPNDKSLAMRIFYILSYPFIFLYAITIPPVRYFFIGSIIMAVCWIGVLCYLATWFISVIGYNLEISDAVMGITLLAIGTSVPEAVASYLLTKHGLAPMAIANAIGSNTFDICICLGLPWLIQIIMHGESVHIVNDGMLFVTFCLMSTAILILIGFAITKFMLDIFMGYFATALYVIFIVASITVFIILCEK